MLDPIGYLDITLTALEIYALIGFLALFFLERTGYGRASIARETWGNILVYNLLTAGAYGIYWRLKASYALSARDRLPPWQWVFVLFGVFFIAVSSPSVFIVVTIWDFILGSKLTKATGEPTSWILTFFFGHIYLASYVADHGERLPQDFRIERREKRPRFLAYFAVFVVLSLAVIGFGYRLLVQHRAAEFASIPGESVDRMGPWFETEERIDRLYREDKNGHRDVFALLKAKRTQEQGEWAQYGLDTKFHAGKLYTYNWFSCVTEQKVVESTASILVLKDAWDKSSVDSTLDEEQFSAKLKDIQRTDRVTTGWEYGALLRSPWDCELRFIQQTWDEAVDTVITNTLDRLPFVKKA